MPVSLKTIAAVCFTKPMKLEVLESCVVLLGTGFLFPALGTGFTFPALNIGSVFSALCTNGSNVYRLNFRLM